MRCRPLSPASHNRRQRHRTRRHHPRSAGWRRSPVQPRLLSPAPLGQSPICDHKYSDAKHQVFDLRLYNEDDRGRRANVCVGYWELQQNQWRRYSAFVEMEKRATTSVGVCDEWVIVREQIEAGRNSCAP